MILWLLCLICCNVGLVLPNPKSPTTDIFVFGFCQNSTYAESSKGRVSFNKAGSITKTQKFVKIPIEIAYCMDLTDVRVEVDNPVGPPVVFLDRELLTITIKYRPKQASKSTYLVSAKTIHDKNCTAAF